MSAGSRIRITHVLGTGEQQAKGISQIVEGLARTLDPNRYLLSALFLREEGVLGRRLRSAGLSVGTVKWKRGWRDVGGAWRFARALRRQRADIVHLHAGGLSPRLVARLAGSARVVVHFHSLKEEAGGGRSVLRSARGADLVIANSAATASSVTGTKPLVIYPGVQLQPRISRSSAAYSDTVTLGVAGRLVPVKGISDLIAALGLLKDQSTKLSLQVAGVGPEQQVLRSEAASAGVSSAVQFVGWRDDMTDLMRKWDIYVQPSLEEGFGIAILEAMAAGLPVIATRVGGIPEIVEDGVTGWLVPAGDPASLANCIAGLVADWGARARLGEAGRARAAEHFSLERASRAMEAAYDRLLA